MKLKNQSTQRSGKVLFLILGIALAGLVAFKVGTGLGEAPTEVRSAHSLENPNYIPSANNYETIIKEGINRIYQDSILAIHINENLGIPFISYVYKNELEGRQKTDNFFLHFYLKDPSNLQKQRKLNFLNMDFKAVRPLEIEVDGKTHYIFKRVLDDPFMDFDNIKHVNTGRYDPTQSSKSYELRNIVVEGLQPKPLGSGLEKMTIEISKKSFDKIKAKRDTALNNNVLITRDDDLVNARVTFKESKRERADARLKGDWTDHLVHPSKWSYRIIMDGEETIDGMRKFSVQHPKSRNYLWEWMFNRIMKENDVIGLRYDFVDVDIAVTQGDEIVETIPMGIMAKEESFDKILIENNRRREGLILAFDESLIWEDREQQYKMSLEDDSRSIHLTDIRNAPIKVFNQNKVLGDPGLSKQFDIAKDLLEGLRSGKLKVSEAFDLDKLTTFVALSNLFSANHGLAKHNLRIYFNPITTKLEPISFDSYSGRQLTQLHDYPFSEEDEEYRTMLLSKMEKMSSSEFINDFVERHYEEMNDLFLSLSTEFNFKHDLTILEYNSNFIKKKINPSNVVVASLVNKEEDKITVEVHNLVNYPVVINDLKHKDGKKLSKRALNTLLTPFERKEITFELDDAFANAFVSKKNKIGEFRYPKDIGKLRMTYNIQGIGYVRNAVITPYKTDREEVDKLNTYKGLFSANVSGFDFISEDENEKVLTVSEGIHELTSNVTIPKGYRVVFEPGAQIDIRNGASFISFSEVQWIGTEAKPIKMYSSDGTGGGIFISGVSETSVVKYCEFSNLSNPTSEIWNLTGAVNFHEANVNISNSVFENNRCEDGLNIIRSEFTIDTSTFKNTLSDAFDGDFVEGSISNSTFINSGNDGIDVSGSTITLKEITVDNPSDKAISAGEASKVSGSAIDVTGGEIGIVSKDLSSVILTDVHIKDTRLGFSCFQKKSEFGVGRIEVSQLRLQNNERDHLIENGSTLLIDNLPVETVSNNVIDQMYGVEYGKSSK